MGFATSLGNRSALCRASRAETPAPLPSHPPHPTPRPPQRSHASLGWCLTPPARTRKCIRRRARRRAGRGREGAAHPPFRRGGSLEAAGEPFLCRIGGRRALGFAGEGAPAAPPGGPAEGISTAPGGGGGGGGGLRSRGRAGSASPRA